ncbi:MAG TPA: hypothetical protein VNN73_11260 [Blastocatellia bacterium]|nr:hypothetical protein [Blastocatellia bacterium]
MASAIRLPARANPSERATSRMASSRLSAVFAMKTSRMAAMISSRSKSAIE